MFYFPKSGSLGLNRSGLRAEMIESEVNKTFRIFLLKACMNASTLLALPHAFWMTAIKHAGW